MRPCYSLSHLLLSAVLDLRAAAPRLVGARRLPPSIDISRQHGAQQQTRRTPRLRSNDGTDRRTDGRTLDRFTDPSEYTCTGWVKKVSCCTVIDISQATQRP